MDLRIRTMRPDEIDIAADWAAAEGWNPGLADAACLFAFPYRILVPISTSTTPGMAKRRRKSLCVVTSPHALLIAAHGTRLPEYRGGSCLRHILWPRGAFGC